MSMQGKRLAAKTRAAGPRQLEPFLACTACPVRAASFCNAVTARNLKTLTRNRQKLQFRPHQVIARQGEPAISFFNVVSGCVKLYRTLSDGRTRIVGFRFPGEFFTTSGANNCSSTAEAITRTEVCSFSRAQIDRLSYLFPELRMRLFHGTNKYREQLEDQIFLLGKKSASQRIASFLLRYSREASCNNLQNNGHVTLAMTRSDIADFLGLTRETVSREITKLVRQKLIVLESARYIRLVNIPSMQSYSGD